MAIAQVSNNNRFGIHPQKFALWAAFASIAMMFAALTSAYVVRRGAGNWLEYQIPKIFFVSTIVLLGSSLSIHRSYTSFLAGKEKEYKLLLVATFILGLVFCSLQYMGWSTLQAHGIEVSGNPSGSFFYVISGLHVAHVLGGIVALIMALIHAFMLPFKVTELRRHRFELVCHYWHFVDILWIYLLSFMIIQQ
ncbi:MAG: cytochrome c oxidase subunit 3 [Saprospiraceae bacterium]